MVRDATKTRAGAMPISWRRYAATIPTPPSSSSSATAMTFDGLIERTRRLLLSTTHDTLDMDGVACTT
jgi:hypothetical protein